jgi:hypothetical protein
MRADVQSASTDAGQRALSAAAPGADHDAVLDQPIAASAPRIIAGPTLIPAPREGETYRWKVQDGPAEKHVYVQIAAALRAETFEEPLRAAILTKGESALVKLLATGNVPTRIKITSAGLTEVGIDRRARPCAV